MFGVAKRLAGAPILRELLSEFRMLSRVKPFTSVARFVSKLPRTENDYAKWDRPHAG